MRKSIKTLVALFIMALCVLQMSIIAYAKIDIPEATSDFYVNDFAGIFSEEEKTWLIDNAVALSNEHNGIQVVVTTVESLNGNSIESYAWEMYNKYGIGKDDMGLLIILSTGDRKIRIEVGRAMEVYITDSDAGRFIDNNAIPYLKEDKFNEGLINLQKALISEIVSCIEKEESEAIAVVENSAASKGTSNKSITLTIIAVLIGIVILVGIILFIFNAINKYKKECNELEHNLAEKNIEVRNLIRSNEQALKEEKRKSEDLIKDITNRQIIADDYKQKLEALTDRYERAKRLHPNLDNEVNAMITEEIRQLDIKKAAEFDTFACDLVHLSANRDIVQKIEGVLAQYNRLNGRQKSYVKTDIPTLKRLYQESKEKQTQYEKEKEQERRRQQEERNKKAAEIAMVAITGVISCISYAKAKDLPKLKEAKMAYDNLSYDSRRYVNDSVVNKLNQLISQANRDKEEEERREEERRRQERRRREEEERRRREELQRRNSYSSHSSFHSGFGGRSGGGGASRGF